MYAEDDYLQISGFQHFSLCRRRWALIYIENQWEDNRWTTAGRIMHKKAHDGSIAEKRGESIIVNSLKVASKKLGISGECDIVQLLKDDEGVYLPKYKGKYKIYPIEYKRGKGQSVEADSVQLCAQAICLEEMLCCSIEIAALFYGASHRRTEIELTDKLRQKVKKYSIEMHKTYYSKRTPKAIISRFCNQCSLKDICLPELGGLKISVGEYLLRGMND